MSAHSSEIVIGIDFGTTHSGVSWAVNGGAKTIRLINNWPNPQARNATSDKVPSAISYVNGNPSKWGYNVGPKDQSFRWIKILLEPDSKYTRVVEPVKKSNELLGQLNKTAIAVVADYLHFLWDYTMDDIEKRQGKDFRQIYALKVIMSVPAMWTPAAKEKTLQAAKAAGLGDNIQLVTEPEAAALATLKDKSDMDELKVGDCFVVCDAGGGTVDLISYQVEKVEPLQVKECAIGNGDLCGSVFLDMGFQKWVTTIVGESQWTRIKEPAKKKMLQDFEYAVKRSFDPKNQQEYSVELKGVEDNERQNISDDTIVVKASVVRTVFDHVCLQIERLVAQQIEQVRAKKNRQVKAILLVGGFGESGYLYDMLENAHKREGISVLQVTGAWSSICRGATMWGLEHSDHVVTTRKTVSSRLARYSIGIVVSQIFDSSKHLLADKVMDTSEGIYRAQGQMNWLIKRGDEFDEDQILDCGVYESVENVGFFTSGSREFVHVLYYSDDNMPPSRKASGTIKTLCSVDFSIDCGKIWLEESYRSPVTGKKWRNCTFHILIMLGNANLAFGVVYKGELAAACEANYPD